MATEKQIAANRANATRSTGPKTAAGKKRSGQNARRHGLSIVEGTEITQNAGRLANTFAELGQLAKGFPSDYFNFACACLTIQRIRDVQTKLMATDRALHDSTILKQLMMTERYDRRALTKLRRAIKRL